VVVKDRVYVVSEPTELLALDVNTGKVLWQRPSNYIDTYKGQEREAAEKELAAARKLRTDLEALKKDLYRMKRKLRGASPTPGLIESTKALESQVNDMRKQYDKSWRVRALPPIELIGYSSSTPVVDETGVYVGFGNGVFSAFELDGTRRWSVGFGRPPSNMRGYHKGHSASPIIVGEQLVVGYRKLRALNKNTGEVAWEGNEFLDFGTPVHLRVGGEDLVATPQGEIYRMKDGVMLTDELGDVWHCGPVVDGATLYIVGSGLGRVGGKGAKANSAKVQSSARAIRLEMKGEKILHTKIWETPVEPGDYYASPVLHGGVLYSLSITGVLMALDSTTGKVHYRKALEPQGRVFASLAVASGRLYAFGPNGRIWVFNAGPHGELMAETEISASLDYRVWSSPFFAGDSVFLREAEHLYRFGKTR